jgi:hypothetical protein
MDAAIRSGHAQTRLLPAKAGYAMAATPCSQVRGEVFGAPHVNGKSIAVGML